MNSFLSQSFPGSPKFTEENIPSLAGKIFIVTGGNAGLGLEIVKLLHSKGGTVYIASRSLSRIATAIEEIKATSTSSNGVLKSLCVDLSDLATISACVADFLAQESRLDVLWNNAGITEAPLGAVTAQGYEAHMGTNCLGSFLLTKLLIPILARTAAAAAAAAAAPQASIRVIFTSSQIVDLQGPPGGVSLTELDPKNVKADVQHNYSASKAGNWMMASEFAKRNRGAGIVFLTQNPGNLRTTGWDQASRLMKLAFGFMLHPAKYGAYTALWAGLSTDVEIEDGGRYVIPWGRWHPRPRKDVVQSLKLKEEGGTGVAAKFWEWCDEQTVPYAEFSATS